MQIQNMQIRKNMQISYIQKFIREESVFGPQLHDEGAVVQIFLRILDLLAELYLYTNFHQLLPWDF